ncbi:mannosyl phosphorylinositol ceramide synthase SUR1 [Ilyonectria robusta]
MSLLLLISTIPLYIIYQFERDDDVLRDYLLNLDDHRTSVEQNHHGEKTAEIIPRIIHQTYINNQIPEKWLPAYRSCQQVHNDSTWTHVLWTDDTARNLIEESYPWFLPTYDSYPYAIQRVDAIRYFVIYHFGGFYLDLDIGCRKPLEPFQQFDAIFPKTQPFGVSNDMMAAFKGHVFFKQLITELKGHSYRVGTKYPTVMWSTGPVFVTQQLANFLRTKQNQSNVAVPASSSIEGTVRVIPHELYASAKYSFFTHHPGSSWHGWDVQGNHLPKRTPLDENSAWELEDRISSLDGRSRSWENSMAAGYKVLWTSSIECWRADTSIATLGQSIYLPHLITPVSHSRSWYCGQ